MKNILEQRRKMQANSL